QKAGVHRVQHLDATLVPRDAKAVGQFGQAVLVSSSEDAQVRERWDEGFFNVYLSDRIPVDRAVPDTRPESCAQSLIHDDLPSTSVIFCFVDEVWSTLLRSVHSVLNRSPLHLLREIILVDDFSTKEYLKGPLDKYMAQFPKVRIIRLQERQGLIRARLAGAAAATGEVLTFLDSHVECNVGWLEPLLERIYLDRRKVPCPVIEVINDKDMSYMLVDNFQRGIFKWPLVFGWSPVPEAHIKKHNLTISDPIRYGPAGRRGRFRFQLRGSKRSLSCAADVQSWLEASSPSSENTSTSWVPTTPAWTCGVERTWRFLSRHSLDLDVRRGDRDHPLLPRGTHLQGAEPVQIPQRQAEDSGAEPGQGGRGLAGRVQGPVLRPRLPPPAGQRPGHRKPDRAEGAEEEAQMQELQVVPGKGVSRHGRSAGQSRGSGGAPHSGFRVPSHVSGGGASG
ncbi:unnamed protein product, partial [Tetraodon nigroviridis]